MRIERGPRSRRGMTTPPVPTGGTPGEASAGGPASRRTRREPGRPVHVLPTMTYSLLLKLDPGGFAPADPLSPSLAGPRDPRSAPAGAPVARSDVEIQRELPRMRPQPDRVHLLEAF